MSSIQQIFQPHQFGSGATSIELWHVYDNFSRTPYEPGVSIQCGDPDEYHVNAWHIITPKAMRRHLNWRNRIDTQFISLYGEEEDAMREAQRRRGRNTPGRGPVRIARVNIPLGSNVWVFSRGEMLNMMRALNDGSIDLMKHSGLTEWFVWGVIPDRYVVDS